MELTLNRTIKQVKDTIGDFLVNGKFMSNCLELSVPADGNYTHGFCIAPGRYEVEVIISPHFGYVVPHIKDVPGRDNIEIHIGNSDTDTHGCVIVGEYVGGYDWITNSVDEFEVLMDILKRAEARQEEMWITITENFKSLS
jgi:hypothetical protein